jgi:hypothetical protein
MEETYERLASGGRLELGDSVVRSGVSLSKRSSNAVVACVQENEREERRKEGRLART